MQAIATFLVQLEQERLQWPAWDGTSFLHVLQRSLQHRTCLSLCPGRPDYLAVSQLHRLSHKVLKASDNTHLQNVS